MKREISWGENSKSPDNLSVKSEKKREGRRGEKVLEAGSFRKKHIRLFAR